MKRQGLWPDPAVDLLHRKTLYDRSEKYYGVGAAEHYMINVIGKEIIHDHAFLKSNRFPSDTLYMIYPCYAPCGRVQA